VVKGNLKEEVDLNTLRNWERQGHEWSCLSVYKDFYVIVEV
jgi:hypothetical protein